MSDHPIHHLFEKPRDKTLAPTLEERQALLKKLPLTPPLHRVTALKESAVTAEKPWERAQREGWEGVIAKRRGSIYEPRRSPNWLKMKVELSQEFVVGGFTDPQGKRVGLGALLVGYYERKSESRPVGIATGSVSVPRAVATGSNDTHDVSEPYFSSPSGRGGVRVQSLAGGPVVSISSPTGRGRVRVQSLATGSSDNVDPSSAQPHFVFAGKIGTGFNTKTLLDLRAQLDKIEIAKPPFTKAIGLPRLRVHWVRPKVVVQVGFIQWTRYGKLRHPRLLGVRMDKDPREVVRE